MRLSGVAHLWIDLIYKEKEFQFFENLKKEFLRNFDENYIEEENCDVVENVIENCDVNVEQQTAQMKVNSEGNGSNQESAVNWIIKMFSRC